MLEKRLGGRHAAEPEQPLMPPASSWDAAEVRGDIMTCHHDVVIQLCKPPSSDVHTGEDALAHWWLLVADASCWGDTLASGS